jgi:hypothetical protein
MHSSLYLSNIYRLGQTNYNETHNTLAEEYQVKDSFFLTILLLLLYSFFVLLLNNNPLNRLPAIV